MNSRLTCVVAVMICLLSALAVLIATPYFTEIYEDFDAELPWLTIAVIWSHLALAGGLAFLGVALAAKEVIFKDRRRFTLSINFICVILVGIIMGVATCALMLPILLADRFVV